MLDAGPGAADVKEGLGSLMGLGLLTPLSAVAAARFQQPELEMTFATVVQSALFWASE